jgi:CheY-like chemotaxis protein
MWHNGSFGFSTSAMNQRTVILVDDVAADRQLAARALQRAGWIVHPARNTTEGDALLTHVVDSSDEAALILTDLHMPADPAHRSGDRKTVAGAQWALRLRAQMERGTLVRLPIVALTALNEHEVHLTALAFGCDAVVPKPVTSDLGERIDRALRRMTAPDADPVGAAALLGLLRYRLAEMLVQPDPASQLMEHDITRALLAYQRRGLAGLGASKLAMVLAPQITSMLARGEHTYAVLAEQLDTIMLLGTFESIAISQGELMQQRSPAEQSAALGLSLSEYYRRRREAIAVLLQMLIRVHPLE